MCAPPPLSEAQPFLNNCSLLLPAHPFTDAWVPVAAVGLLSFIVFFMPKEGLVERLAAVLTVFLALAAIQFVISDGPPRNGYVYPLQLYVVITCFLFVAIGIESIAVYQLATRPQRLQQSAVRAAGSCCKGAASAGGCTQLLTKAVYVSLPHVWCRHAGLSQRKCASGSKPGAAQQLREVALAHAGAPSSRAIARRLT